MSEQEKRAIDHDASDEEMSVVEMEEAGMSWQDIAEELAISIDEALGLYRAEVYEHWDTGWELGPTDAQSRFETGGIDVMTDGGVDQGTEGTYRIHCPECDWNSREFDDGRGEIAAKVDAEMHYVGEHDERIPADAPFGHNQCTECLDVDGFSGTVSCSACGFVPESVRA